MTSSVSRTGFARPGVLLVGFILASAGCGEGNPHLTGANVSGKVLHKGNPVTGGTIRLVSTTDERLASSGEIKGDGTYQVANAPAGEVIVVVETDSASFNAAAFMGNAPPEVQEEVRSKLGPPKKRVPIDKKYASPDSSTLRMTLQKGDQVQDVDVP